MWGVCGGKLIGEIGKRGRGGGGQVEQLYPPYQHIPTRRLNIPFIVIGLPPSESSAPPLHPPVAVMLLLILSTVNISRLD